MKAESTSYTPDEVSRLLIEEKVRVVDDRVVNINREEQSVDLAGGHAVPYDTLILAMGLQDQTLRSGSIAHKNLTSFGTKTTPNFSKTDGIVSIDDPYLEEYLAPDSNTLSEINYKKPRQVVI